MLTRFTVLASGSSGNASLLEAGGFGLLVDAGLGPRQLASRMAVVGASWNHVHAVLLTHTHGDHWKERTLRHLRRKRIPLHCHGGHGEVLRLSGGEFARLQAACLVRVYDGDREVELAPHVRCRPLPIRHDGGPTFGFRFQIAANGSAASWSLGYVADLGMWTPQLAEALADVDVLALEFNHDIEMEYASGRPPELITRILGDEGHLSNVQAAELLHEVVRRSTPGRLQHVIQLHLSRECNKSTLASEAAQTVLAATNATFAIHTASQHYAGPCLSAGAAMNGTPPATSERARTSTFANAETFAQPWLPGWEC
jgi:phosphoribosyl 1,2-cyclic phosphodiesterase